MISLLLVSLINMQEHPQIDIIDSRDDSRVTFIIINEICKIPVYKSSLKDYDKVISEVLKKCGL